MARAWKVVDCAEETRDSAQAALSGGPDVHNAQNHLSNVLYRAAEGLALAGVEDVDCLLRITRAGYIRGRLIGWEPADDRPL